MIDLHFPIRRRLYLVTEQVGDETLVYDEERHKAFCLNPVASAVWSLCDGYRTPAQVAEAASLQLAHPVAEETVLFALHQLRADGLLEASPDAVPVAQLSRRTMLARAGAGAFLMLPVIAVIAAPKAAQAYTGCVDCTPVDNSTPVNAGSPSDSPQPTAPTNKRQITPE